MQGDRSGSETEELCYKDLKECIRGRNATNVSSLVVEKRESKPSQDFSSTSNCNQRLLLHAASSDLLAFQKLSTRKTSKTIQDSIDAFLRNTIRHEQDDDLRISADRKQIFP
jgi:hypothetical protein